MRVTWGRQFGCITVFWAVFSWGCSDGDHATGNNPSQDPVDHHDDVTVHVADAGSAIAPSELPPYGDMLPGNIPDDVGMIRIGPVSVKDGESAEVSVVFPADVRSAMFYVYGHNGASVILKRVDGPSGVIVDDVAPSSGVSEVAGPFPGQFYSKNRIIPSVTTGAWLVPNSPEVKFGEGTYHVKFGAYAVDMQTGALQAVDKPLYIALLVRRAKEVKTKGSLDLVLHFTGARGLTAANAKTDRTLQDALKVMRDAYGSVGVTLGDIHYVDLNDPSLRTIILPEGTCAGGDLDKLLKHSSDTEHTGLHLFFVDHFQCMIFGQFDMGQYIGGISGGIPGMALAKGTTHSGVAVSLAMFAQDPTTTAVVMAHESGHFLGLYHTQENRMMLGGVGVYDNIADTPDTEAGAGANLMNYTAGTTISLSPGQGFVMRNNPLVK